MIIISNIIEYMLYSIFYSIISLIVSLNSHLPQRNILFPLSFQSAWCSSWNIIRFSKIFVG